MNTLETLKGIYLGERDLNFKSFITQLLKKGDMKQKYIDILTSDESMEIYSAVFTSELVDENNNYQVYEQLGDLTGNKFIVWYIYQRFPRLKCTEGVKVAARLRINYGAKNSFFAIAEKFGFWEFISAPHDLRQRKKKSLLEDVFEAFIGATESILDESVSMGTGYKYVYKFLQAVFDDMKISLKYEDLYDSKTRLKELFDSFKERLGTLYYEEKKEDLITYSYCFRVEGFQGNIGEGVVLVPSMLKNCKKTMIGKGSAALKADAQQSAATDALKNLEKQGFSKKAPEIYLKLEENSEIINKTDKKDILDICKNAESINEQFLTRGKNNYQNKYTSTALGLYCRKRDYEGIKQCLALNANPNIMDSEGMSCSDLVIIGVPHYKLVYKCLEKFLKSNDKLFIQKNVYDIYFKVFYLETESKYQAKFIELSRKFIVLKV